MSTDFRARRPLIRPLISISVLTIAISALTGTAAEPSYVLGADISWIPEREASGTKYAHNGQVKDMLDILKENKFNYIRLRIFVDPKAVDNGKTDASGWNPYPYSAKGYCGLDSTIKMAKRVKAAGMGFLLDFHYSDTWADPGKQYKPLSWSGLSGVAAVEGKVRSYTKESLEAFKAAGALPDMVQVGNEVVNGMIHPDGSGNSVNFAKLVNAGINGVKDVDPDIKIMMHTINERNPNGWVNTLRTNLNNVEAGAANKIDVIGLSYYPKWHGNVDSLKRSLTAIANNANHNYKVAVAEYADKHREVNDMVFALPANRRIGTFVWEPEEFSGDDSKPLFDWKNNRRETNSLMALYPVMAKDYGIDNNNNATGVIGINNGRQVSTKNLYVVRGGIIAYKSNAPGVINIHSINGKTVGRINVNAPGLYDPSRLLKSPLKSGAYVLSIESIDGKRISVGNLVVKK